MAGNETAILTVMCMLTDENKILMQDRIKPNWSGFTFPGGHVEKGESFVHAVIREMKEETGLTVHCPELSGIKQFQTMNDERYIVFLFKADSFSGELCSSDEGKMHWIDRENLVNLSVASGFFDILKVYDENTAIELLYDRDKKDNTLIPKWF